MDYNSRLKETLKYFLTGGAIASICFLTVKELKGIQKENRIINSLIRLKEALDKCDENSKILEVIRTLKALEDEIKDSQDEKLLQLHHTLAKNIAALPNFQLKE